MFADFETSCSPMDVTFGFKKFTLSHIAQMIQYRGDCVYQPHDVVVNVHASQPLIQPLFEF